MEELEFSEELDTNHVQLDYDAPIVIEYILEEDTNEVLGEITYNP